MDPANLQTAATYVNNLLLARGLLRDGKPVEFAALMAPGENSREKTSDGRGGDKEGRRRADTVVQLINLVHDMILRRDRDQESHHSLSTTLTTLRTSHSTATTAVTRLQDCNSDLRRQLEASHAATRAAQQAANTAEASARALRDELVRARNTLVQVRGQCVKDVRRRDVELRRLKGHLSDAQRGAHGAAGRSVGASCTVSGGGSARREADAPPSLEDAEYSLRQETTGFLTQLSQSMSEENDALIALVRETLAALRGLMDLPAGPAAGDASVRDDEFVTVVPVSYELLAGDLRFVLGRLRALLTRDDFVPIAEVYARDGEILRLRDGWERIGARWAEAVQMMQAWQERMVKSGDTVNLAELRAGLNLGEGLRLMEAAAPAAEEEEGEPDDPRSEFEPVADADVLFADVQAVSSSPAPSPPVSAALREASGNVVSPTSLTARVRRLRLQASQRALEQQENAATGSPSPSSSSSLRSERAANADADSVKPHTKPMRTAPPPGSTAPVSTRPAARQTQPATRNGTRSKTPPASASTSTANRPVPRSPFHTHLNSLLASSAVSSPEKEDKDPARPSPASRSYTRPTARPVRIASSTSTTLPPASSPSKAPAALQSRLRTRPRAPDIPHDSDNPSDNPDAEAAPSAPPGMSVSEKLRHAESEARRVSGFALSSSPGPAPELSPVRCVDAADDEVQAEAEAVPAADLDVEARAGCGAIKAERDTLRKERHAGDDPVRPVKRSDVRGRGTVARRGRRRKSTLSPEELEALMGLRSPGEG